jgi:hypothetical protein
VCECVHSCSVVKIIICRKEELSRALVKRKEQVEEIEDFGKREGASGRNRGI